MDWNKGFGGGDSVNIDILKIYTIIRCYTCISRVICIFKSNNQMNKFNILNN